MKNDASSHLWRTGKRQIEFLKLILMRSLLIYFLVPQFSRAAVEIFEKQPESQDWVKSTLQNKFTLSFLPLGTKPGKRLVYKGTINFLKPIESFQTSLESTHATINDQVLAIEILGFEDKIKVKFKDKSESEIKLLLTENQFRMFNDQCKKYLINTQIQPAVSGTKIPFFPIGLSCDKYEDKIILVVSLPAEVEGGESSLVEGGGKGESWKFYELPSTSREDGVIGAIKFTVNSVALNLSLQNIRLKKKDEDVKSDLTSKDKNFFQEMSFATGSKSLSFQAGSISSAAGGFAMEAYLRTKPIWRQFQLAGSYSTAIVSSSDENNITYSEFSGFLGYGLDLKKSKLLPFGFAKLVDFLHKSTQTRLQATLAGVGFDYALDLSKGQARLNFEYGAFAAKGISSQMRYQIGYQYLILEKLKMALGLYYNNQEFKALNSAGETRIFKEGNILLKVTLNSN